jgi:hypothetical protein
VFLEFRDLGLTHCLYLLRQNGANTGRLPLRVVFVHKSWTINLKGKFFTHAN